MGAGAASPLRPVGCPKTTQVEPAGDDGAPRNLVNFWGDELQFGPPGEPKLLRRGIGMDSSDQHDSVGRQTTCLDEQSVIGTPRQPANGSPAGDAPYARHPLGV
ncbi:hypothetical protein VTN96DRAFT_8987 [Rasamsonia emersonii]